MRWSFVFLFLATALHAANPQVSPPASFGGGLNLATIPSDISEQETPDSNNMINTAKGSAEKRNGSRFYISQAFSTNPVASLYRAYGSTTNYVVKKLLATTRDKILVSTGGDIPVWVILSSDHVHNAHWTFAISQNKLIMGDDELGSNMLHYDLMTGSITNHIQQFVSSDNVKIRAKYIKNIGDQMIAANVLMISTPEAILPGATYYNSRMYYTPILYPSSFTYQRYLVFGEDDGEGITGISDYQGIYIWKPSKVFKLTYTDLSPGGDMQVNTVVNGFGLFAPRSLAFTGDFFIFCDKGGVRLWDGSVKTRLQVEQESKVISEKIQPIVDRCVRSGTWEKASGFFYPKKRWYLLSVEDPILSPKGRHNLVLVFDLDTLSWHRFTNWNAESWCVMDGAGDKGDLLYGSSEDGFVIYADDENSSNDARRELAVNGMEKIHEWKNGNPEVDRIAEGTASVRMTINENIKYSSITFMGLMDFGEWTDKKRVDKNDRLSFRVYATSLTNLTNLRVDLLLEDTSVSFTDNFTSVTLLNSAFSNGDSNWTAFEIALSSFPILAGWTDIDSEILPFANTLTFFGIRFYSEGTNGYNLYFDDLRVTDHTERPLSAYRWTKQFNFGVLTKKEFKSIFLNCQISPDSQLYVDIYKDFGSFVDRRTISGDFGKEIFVSGFGNRKNILKLDSVTFDEMISTEAMGTSLFSVGSLAVDEDYLYAGDQRNNKILKIDKSSFTAFVSTYGGLGSGATTFNWIGQISMDRDYLYIADTFNHRVKVHRKSDLSYVRDFGQLGNNTTSFHLPKGVAVDGDSGNLYVANDGGAYNILKLDKDTGDFKISAPLELNTYGDPSLAVDEQYLYCAYRLLSEDVFSTELVLERRDKSSLEVLNSKIISPKYSSVKSSYTFEGDISISGDYLYLVFSDNITGGNAWYLQKLIKSDLSVVKEAVYSRKIETVSANEMSFLPTRKTIEEVLGTEGRYVQLKFSEGDALDNSMKFYNHSYKVIQEETQ